VPDEKKRVAGRKSAARGKQTRKAGTAKRSAASKARMRPGKTVDEASVHGAVVFEGPTTEVAFPVVAVGASAGGLEAFEAFFKAMPSDSGMAFVLVAHLDPTHVSLLPELVQKSTKMSVSQIRNGMKMKPNAVYVIPPNKDLNVLNGILHLTELSQPRGSNLPIDNFFRSLAQDQGANAICIILSGTGTDGTLGLKAIKGAVGMVMVQEEASAKYDGMPRSAIGTGLADYVLSPENMPSELVKYTKRAIGKSRPRIVPAEGPTPDALQKIFIILRTRTDHDFSLYKKNTIFRRIERRMNVHQIDDISEYVRYLRDSDREVDILFKELLIGVTNFFRDSDAFDTLQKKVLPKLLIGKPDDYTLRVWVPGCSTGEEAYSVAIILHECMESARHFNLQVFGTDIDEDSINAARAGLYPASILADVGPDRLKRYFVKEDDGQYRIKKIIREMLVFAPQNIIKDPPFTKLDLLCCRNLLIYLGPELQRRLLPIFHYSLKQDGILFLGTSETIGQASDLFAIRSKKWKIFQSKPSGTVRTPLDFPAPLSSPEDVSDRPTIPETVKKAEELSVLQLVETILAKSEMPPCIVIDDAFNLVYVHGKMGKFLEPAQGKASVNALKMARQGVKAELASAVRKVSLHKQEVVLTDLCVEHNGSSICFELLAKPILEQGPLRGLMLVMFQEISNATKSSKAAQKPKRGRRPGKNVEELARELQYTKENLQTTIEELETSNEELKSTNEELQSTNEELQSTNEEMETSKEELQSLNEESATVNAELQSRIDELSNTNDDMKNLLDSTAIATLFLDTNLCIRRFTPKVIDIIPLAGTDSGRPIMHFATSLSNTDLTEYGRKVLEDLAVREAEVESKDGVVYAMKARPYRTINNVIDGVVVTFEDITARKRVEEELRESEIKWRAMAESTPALIVVLDRVGKVLFLNCVVPGLAMGQVAGASVYDYVAAVDRGLVEEKLGEVFETGRSVTTKNRSVGSGSEIVWHESCLAPIDIHGQVGAVVFISKEITDTNQK
jgi:two-component system, chemotaxis family, CheB/CheR fusion protein